MDQIMHLVNHVVDIQRDLGAPLLLKQLDKIYDKCRASDGDGRPLKSGSIQIGIRPTPSMAPSDAATSAASDPRDQDLQILQTGAYRGLTFAAVYTKEVNYTGTMIGKLRTGALKDPELIRFATYAQRRRAQPPSSPSRSLCREL